jgi:hypothetical protein
MGPIGPSFCAVCWHPTSLIVPVGPSLVLYVGNLQEPAGPSLGRSHGGYWTNFGAVSWQSCFHRHTRPALTIQPPS